MSRSKNIVKILNACEKHEFDKVVKTYLREIYGYKRIVLTDGKDDTGLDLKVFDFGESTHQFQMTIQKSETTSELSSFKKKLFGDIIKAKENMDSYGYSNNLFFFYSYELTNKVKRELKKDSLELYGINLSIIDAKQIAEESEEFIELQNVIYETSGFGEFQLKKNIFEDESQNLIYDLIGFGKSADVKLQIVEAFVLQLLFTQATVSKDDIINKCRMKFSSNENLQFYEKLIRKLVTSKQLLLKKENGEYCLTDNEYERITRLNEKNQSDEKIFITEISVVLLKYHQEDKIEEYIYQLKLIYSKNFNTDLLSGIADRECDLFKISREFTQFIEKNLSKEYSPKELAIELFTVCNDNKYLQKNCASKVFSEQTNLQRLENYVNTKKKIFVDTTLPLYLLCYYFKPKNQYNTYMYRVAVSFYEFCKKRNLPLYIVENYLWEVQNHVREALNLIPFTSLPNFHLLGKSRNVFYNFYLHLKNNEGFIENFETFLAEFGFIQHASYKQHNNYIEKHLGQIGFFKYEFKKKYDIEDTKRLIQEQLIADNKVKTNFGLNNDAIMFEFLGDNDIDTHSLQPIFVTWDKTLAKTQSKYFKNNPNSQRWIQFTPSQIIDYYSILNFSIDSDAITSDIIAVLSDDIIQNTHSLLDSLAVILNPENEVGLAYTNRLAQLRDNEIYKVRQTSSPQIQTEDIENELVIDDIVYQLTNHYRDNTKEYEVFKMIFTQKEYIDSVVSTINDAIDFYYKEHYLANDILFSNFDKYIEEIKIFKIKNSKE